MTPVYYFTVNFSLNNYAKIQLFSSLKHGTNKIGPNSLTANAFGNALHALCVMLLPLIGKIKWICIQINTNVELTINYSASVTV